MKDVYKGSGTVVATCRTESVIQCMSEGAYRILCCIRSVIFRDHGVIWWDETSAF